MKKIGNIFTKNKILDATWCNITDKRENLIKKVPTLVVGLENARKFSDNFNILDWKLDENTYWTFGKREQRNVYEKRMDDFLNICLNFQKKSIKYDFFNVLTKSNDEKRELFEKIRQSNSCICFLYNDMAYFYINNDNNIIGLSLRDIDYKGMDKNKFLMKLKSMDNVKIYTNKYDFPLPVRQFLINSTYVSPKLCE